MNTFRKLIRFISSLPVLWRLFPDILKAVAKEEYEKTMQQFQDEIVKLKREATVQKQTIDNLRHECANKKEKIRHDEAVIAKLEARLNAPGSKFKRRGKDA